MTGTILNAAAIVLGGLAGLTLRRGLPAATQGWLKIALAVASVFFGLRLTVVSLSGSVRNVLKQILLVVLALTLGKLIGKLLRLQHWSNRVGQQARQRMAAGGPETPGRFGTGFTTCTFLFCVAPLAVLGAVTDGLSGYVAPLVIKAVMDGLAAMSFVAIWGGGVLLAALPVLAYQGTITLLVARFAEPWLRLHGALDAVNATAGLLVFCVGLLIFETRRIEVTNYLPALIFAPLLAWGLGW